jgi:hypothetical protein
MAKQKKVTVSRMFCTQCGREGIPIPRRPGSQREAGHLKKLYCNWCKEETNHAEVRSFGSYTKEDFDLEFKLGRFVDGQKVPIKDLTGCTKQDCEYNVNGRCWNSNYSYKECTHRLPLELK